MGRLILTLKLAAPPAELSPNNLRRYHRMQRSIWTKRARHSACYAALEALGPGPRPKLEHAAVQCRLSYADARSIKDPDNALAWLKPVFDGLTDAGVFASDKRITHYPVVQVVNKKEAGELRVVIAEQEADPDLMDSGK